MRRWAWWVLLLRLDHPYPSRLCDRVHNQQPPLASTSMLRSMWGGNVPRVFTGLPPAHDVARNTGPRQRQVDASRVPTMRANHDTCPTPRNCYTPLVPPGVPTRSRPRRGRRAGAVPCTPHHQTAGASESRAARSRTTTPGAVRSCLYGATRGQKLWVHRSHIVHPPSPSAIPMPPTNTDEPGAARRHPCRVKCSAPTTASAASDTNCTCDLSPLTRGVPSLVLWCRSTRRGIRCTVAGQPNTERGGSRCRCHGGTRRWTPGLPSPPTTSLTNEQRTATN